MYTIIGGDGREYGPVNAEQVRRWIAAGRANLETKIKAAGDVEWKTVADFPEIIAAGIEPPALGGVADGPVAEVRLASRWARLGAAVFDGILQTICLLPFLLTVDATALSKALQTHDLRAIADLPGLMVGGSVSGLLFLILGITQIVLLSLRGQSLGKLVVGVRIVRHPDGAPAGFVRAWFLRSFVMSLLFCIPIPGVGGVLALTDILFVFRPDRRCLHDLLAGTMVVLP